MIDKLNKTVKEHLDYMIVLCGQFLSKALMLVIFLLLPALIGVEEYGLFAYAFSFCLIFGLPFIEFGLDPIVTKYVSRGYDSTIKDSLIYRIYTSVFGLCVLLATSFVLNVNLKLVIILYMYFLFFSLSNMSFAYLRGKGKFLYESILLPLFRVFIILFILVLSKIFFINNSQTGAISFSLSAMIIFILSMYFLRVVYVQSIDKSRVNILEKDKTFLLKEGAIIFLSTLLWAIYFRVDSVMLGFMIGNKEVGIYTLAYRLYEGTIFLPASIMIVIFPRLASYRKKKLRRTFKNGIIILSIISLITFTGLFLVGEIVIRYLYSDDFVQSIDVLKILSFTVLIVFPAHLTTQFLIARDKNRLFLFTTLLGTVVNLLLNWILIPEWKSVGAAYSTLITEVLILILSGGLSLWIIRKEL